MRHKYRRGLIEKQHARPTRQDLHDLDPLPLNKVRAFEDGLLSTLRGKNADILNAIRDSRDLSDDTAAKLKSVVEAYSRTFA